MDILEMVRTDLKGATVAHQREVAAAIGLPWSTLRKIVDGRTKNPRYNNVEALRAYYLSPRDLAASSAVKDRDAVAGDALAVCR